MTALSSSLPDTNPSMVEMTLRPFKLLSMLVLSMTNPSAAFHVSLARFFPRVAVDAPEASVWRQRGSGSAPQMQVDNMDDQIHRTKMEWFTGEEEGAVKEKYRYAGVLLREGRRKEEDKLQAETLLRDLLRIGAKDLMDFYLLDVFDIKRMLGDSLVPYGDLDEAERLLQEALSARINTANFDDVSVAIQTLQAREALGLEDSSGSNDNDLIDESRVAATEIDQFMRQFQEPEERKKVAERNRWGVKNRVEGPWGYYEGLGYEESKDESTFQGYLEKLREDIRIVLKLQYDLAEIEFARDNMELAKSVHLEVFTERCKAFGNTDPDTLVSAQTLARVLERKGLQEQAELLYKRFASLTQEVQEKEYEEKLNAAVDGRKDINIASHLQLDVDQDGESSDVRFVFVDEPQCIGCTHCASVAKNTFFMEEEAGRARVYGQGQDDQETLEDAIACCPVNCISYVDLEDLIVLETEREQEVGLDEYSLLGGRRNSFSRSKLFTTGAYTKQCCGNCPTNGCKDCPMFGVGENPSYKRKLAEREAKKAKKMAEAAKIAAQSMPLIFEAEPEEEDLVIGDEEVASEVDLGFAAWAKRQNDENDDGIQWQ